MNRSVLRAVTALLLLLVMVAAPCLAAQPAVPEPPPLPDDRARCPVCGMFVAPFPTWMAALVSASGEVDYFDGPKDMFRHRVALSEQGKAQGLHAFVTEYYSAELVAADDLFFVAGSDVMGPMGPELVPIAGQAQAKEFRRDHGGITVYTFDQITPEVVSRLP